MTVKELRDALDKLCEEIPNANVKIWLPGSRIYLTSVVDGLDRNGDVLIEGNVDPGSALDN